MFDILGILIFDNIILILFCLINLSVVLLFFVCLMILINGLSLISVLIVFLIICWFLIMSKLIMINLFENL